MSYQLIPSNARPWFPMNFQMGWDLTTNLDYRLLSSRSLIVVDTSFRFDRIAGRMAGGTLRDHGRRHGPRHHPQARFPSRREGRQKDEERAPRSCAPGESLRRLRRSRLHAALVRQEGAAAGGGGGSGRAAERAEDARSRNSCPQNVSAARRVKFQGARRNRAWDRASFAAPPDTARRLGLPGLALRPSSPYQLHHPSQASSPAPWPPSTVASWISKNWPCAAATTLEASRRNSTDAHPQAR